MRERLGQIWGESDPRRQIGALMDEAAMMYSFRVNENPTRLRFLLGPGERHQVFGWLSGASAESMTIEDQGLRITRALLGGSAEEAPVQGVAVEYWGQLVGIVQSVAQQWAADLEAAQAGVYEAVNADETMPIRDV